MRQVPKFFSIFTVVMFAEVGNNLLTPILAFLFFSENSSLFLSGTGIAKRSLLFGLCLSLYKAGGVLANFLITTISDFRGRKFALYCSHTGLLTLALMGGAALYFHSPFLLISGFFILSLLNANLATGPAIISDISHDENRVINMATIQCILAMGACLGPMIGGKLGSHHWFFSTAYVLPFAAIGLVAILSIFILQFCPETLESIAHAGFKNIDFPFKEIWKDYQTMFLSKNIRWLLFLLILCQMSWSSYYEFISPILKNVFHFSPAQVGVFVGLIAFWLIIASSIGIRFLLKWFNHQQLIWLSSLALAIGTLMNLISAQNPAEWWGQLGIWFSAVPIAMGDVIFFALFSSFLAQNVNAKQRGKAMGLTLTLATLVWSLMALAGGAILSYHFNGIFWLIPLGSLGLLSALWFSAQPFRFMQNSGALL